MEGEGEAERHRMRHRQELDIERAYFPSLPISYRDELGAVGHARFVYSVSGQAESHR